MSDLMTLPRTTTRDEWKAAWSYHRQTTHNLRGEEDQDCFCQSEHLWNLDVTTSMRLEWKRYEANPDNWDGDHLIY